MTPRRDSTDRPRCLAKSAAAVVRASALMALSACAGPSPKSPSPYAGRLTPPVIQATIRQHYDIFRGCYEVGLGRNPQLVGKVLIRVVIRSDGTVSYAQDGGSDLPDRRVVECIVEEVSRIEFPSSKGQTTAVYPVMFQPG